MSEAATTIERPEDDPAEKPASAPAPAPARPGAPAMPPFTPMPAWRVPLYIFASLMFGLTQGLGLNLVSANLTGLQGAFSATQQEMGWLAAAYFATNLTGTIFMYKVRTQFGMRRFAEIGILVFAALAIAHLFTNDLRSAIVVRAAMGIAAAPLSTLAFFYMLEWLPPQKKMSIGICFGMMGTTLSVPLARVISPELLQLGDWHGLYLLEVGMALVSLTLIFLVPISHPPRQKVFDKDDLVSFPLMTVGLGGLAIVLSMGRSFWWFEAPWVGVLSAVSLGCLALLAVVELHRKNPIIDLRWVTSHDMLLFAGALIVFRLLLSEQTIGFFGLTAVLGLQNDQMIPLFWMVGIVTFIATAVLSQVIKLDRVPHIHMVALIFIAIGAWLDAQSTSASRVDQFLVSQALVGVASAIFLPPAMLAGFMKAMTRGPQYILSFLAVFLTTQSLGGLIGSAVFGTFVTLREQFHSNVLAQDITLLNPLVAQRVQTYGAAYGKVLTDPVQQQAQGLSLLGQAATQQANVLAYNDLFLMIFWLTLVAIAALGIHMLITALNKRAPQMKAQAA